MISIYSFIASGLLASITASIVVWLSKNWMSEKIKNSIKHEYDLKLASMNNELKIQADFQGAQLKASIEKEAEKMRFATSFISESQKILIIRQMDGIDILWNEILATREKIPTAILYVDFFYHQMDHLNLADDINDIKDIIDELDPYDMNHYKKIEHIRPHLGEYIWTLYATYHAIINRIISLIRFSKINPSKIFWHEDDDINKLLESSLSESEFLEFKDKANSYKMDWIQNKYEFKILTSMRKISTGQELGEEALHQINSMEKVLQMVKESDAEKSFKDKFQ